MHIPGVAQVCRMSFLDFLPSFLGPHFLREFYAIAADAKAKIRNSDLLT
jgi:hypothetical protein